MIKQECIGIPDMILLLMIFCFKKIKIKAEIVLSPGGAYFQNSLTALVILHSLTVKNVTFLIHFFFSLKHFLAKWKMCREKSHSAQKPNILQVKTKKTEG